MFDIKASKKLQKRYARTLYYGTPDWQDLDRLSLAQTDFAVRYFDKHAPFDYLDSKFVNHLSYEGSVKPTAFILAMIYLERVRLTNKSYFESSDPADLLCSSILCAMKYLYDEGEEEHAYSDEWAASCSKSVSHVVEKEFEFLENIEWRLFVRPYEFDQALASLEFCLALQEGLKRNFFTYSDLTAIFDSVPLKNYAKSLLRTLLLVKKARRMNAIAALCHFCEAHGPRVVFCCQPYRCEVNDPEPHCSTSVFLFEDSLVTNYSSRKTLTGEQNGRPNEKMIFYGKMDQHLQNAARMKGDSLSSYQQCFPTLDYDVATDSCPACLSSESLKPSFLTNDLDEKISFLGSQLPYKPEVLSVVKHACVRSLSCEICPDHEGPIFFGDETNGYCLCYTFSLKDSKARGFQRWYSLCVISPDQFLLINFYDLLTKCLRITANYIQNEAQLLFDQEQCSSGENLAQIAFSGRLSWMPSGFMKEKVTGRNGHLVRSLAQVTNDQHIFCKIHRFFVWTLKLPLIETVNQVLDGIPSQDDIVKTELAKQHVENLDLYDHQHHNNKHELRKSSISGGGDQRIDAGGDNNSCRFHINVYSDVNLPYARFLNDDVFTDGKLDTGDKVPGRIDNSRLNGTPSSSRASSFSTIEKSDDREIEAVLNLKVLYEIFGMEAFRILASHVVVGDQIVVQTETPKIAELVINALQTLLPVGCCRTVYFSENYLAPWSCNFLGLAETAMTPETRAVPDTHHGQSVSTKKNKNDIANQTVIDDSFVVLTAKWRENRKIFDPKLRNIRLEACNFRLHHVGVPPNSYPSFVDRLLALLSHFSNDQCQNVQETFSNFSPTNLPSVPIFQRCLTALKEEWLDKAKLFLQFSKQSRTMNIDCSSRRLYFAKIAKIDKSIDETVAKFFQAGLSKQYKTYVTAKIASAVNFSDVQLPTRSEDHSYCNPIIHSIIMPTTSVKHRDFVGESMGDKYVTTLAGIGETYGKKLEAEGYDKAYVVLGQYLLLKKQKDLFKDWLKEVAGVTSQHSESCYNCLTEWCDQHL